MMALNDPTEIEMLRERIAILESHGQSGLADRLRDELRELEVAQAESELARAYDVESETTEADETDPGTTSTLGAFRRVRRTLVRLWITKLDDLAEWNVRRFRAAGVRQRDIELIYSTMAALEMSSVIGSGDVPVGVPDPNPYAIDLLDGRTVEDVSRMLDGMARGDLTQREASIEAGSPEDERDYGHPHQRAGSLIDRHSCYYAGACLRALKEEYRGAMWLKGVAVENLDGVKKRPWALRIELRCPAAEAVRTMKAAKLLKSEGHSWRGCRIIFVEGN